MPVYAQKSIRPDGGPTHANNDQMKKGQKDQGHGGMMGGGHQNHGGNNNDNGNLNLGVDVTILNVIKKDADAKPNPKGEGRLVPVMISWKNKLSPGAKLMELEAVLKTSNTDNSNTTVTKMLGLTDTNETLMLPMPEGVFAKEFVLRIKSKCGANVNGANRVISSEKIKSGVFPLPNGRLAR